MKITIKEADSTSQLIKQLKQLGRSTIQAGIFEDGDIGMIAAVHEYGTRIQVTDKMRAWFAYNGYPLRADTTEIVIPERSFIRAGFDANEKKIAQNIESLMGDFIESGISVDEFLDAIGTSLASYLKKYLVDLKSPANSSMTIERKGSANPLVDTGRLRDAIKHKVE